MLTIIPALCKGSVDHVVSYHIVEKYHAYNNLRPLYSYAFCWPCNIIISHLLLLPLPSMRAIYYQYTAVITSCLLLSPPSMRVLLTMQYTNDQAYHNPYPLCRLYTISAQNGHGKSSCRPWQHPGESPTHILHEDKIYLVEHARTTFRKICETEY